MLKCIKSACAPLPQRWVTCLLCSGCLVICSIYRQTYLQTFKNIVYDSTIRFKYHRNISNCPYMMSESENYEGSDDSQTVYYYWNPEVVRAVHQAYQIGFMVTVVPAGMMADFSGPRVPLLLGVAIITGLSLLSPTVLQLEPALVLMTNLVEGVSHGVLWPSLAVLSATWAPHTQRARFCSAIFSGYFIGWGLGYFLEYLIYNYVTSNWEISFYVVSIISIIWLSLNIICLYSSAETSPHTLLKEVSFIKQNLEGFQQERHGTKVRWRIPFRTMLTSPPVISLILIDWAITWLHQVTFSHMDMYFFHIVRMTDRMSTMVKVTIEFLIAPSSIFWGVVSDYLVNADYMSRTSNRTLFSFAGNMLAVICLITLPFVGCKPINPLIVYTILCYFQGPSFLVLLTNAVDLSPQRAGVLFGLVKFVASTAAICSWELMWFFCEEYCDAEKWKTVFMVSALVLVVLSLPYLRFGSAEVQSWNYFSEPTISNHQMSSSLSQDSK